jgi:uncharacterized protein involved in exopolysaccharide biosynthesis
VLPGLVLAIAVCISRSKLPELYKSTALISTTNSKIGESDLAALLTDIRHQVNSPETVEAVSIRPARRDALTPAADPRIAQRISVESAPSSDSIAVSFRAEDPEAARIGADVLARRVISHSLVARSVEAQTAPDSTLDALRKRAAEISARISELEEREPRLSVDTDYSQAPSAQAARTPQPSAEFIRAQEMTIEGLKDQQYKFQQELTEVERRIAEQRQIVEQQSKGSSLRDNPTYAVLIAKRTELQGQRDTLINRQELTDKHPRVLAINDQIAAINRQIEELRQQDSVLVSQSPEARELSSLLSERNRLKIELEVTNRELVRRSQSQSVAPAPAPQPVRRETSSLSLSREYTALKRNEKEVTAEIQALTAKYGQAAPPAPTQLQLLKPADLPASPTSPNRLLLISAAGIVGLALGAVFVLLAESTRFNSLQNARDVEFYARLPLLGTIPRTMTAEEKRSARWRTNARFFFGVAASVLLTAALTHFFIASDIFSLITKK